MTLRKDDLQRRRTAWANAMFTISRDLGPHHWITKGMGSIAWGRYDGEPTPTDSVVNVAMGWGFLQGVRYALLQVARDQNLSDEASLARIHQRTREQGGI